MYFILVGNVLTYCICFAADIFKLFHCGTFKAISLCHFDNNIFTKLTVLFNTCMKTYMEIIIILKLYHRFSVKAEMQNVSVKNKIFRGSEL